MKIRYTQINETPKTIKVQMDEVTYQDQARNTISGFRNGPVIDYDLITGRCGNVPMMKKFLDLDRKKVRVQLEEQLGKKVYIVW